MVGQIVGTPDWQRGVASAQKLMGKILAGGSSITVDLPPSCETVAVVVRETSRSQTINVVGGVSGLNYPYGKVTTGSGTAFTSIYYIGVSSVVDSSITITLSATSTLDAFVYSDLASHLSFDPSLASSLATEGSTIAPSVLMFGGSDGVNAHPALVDTSGRFIPFTPNKTTGAVSLPTVNAEFLAAPSAGSNYLFGADAQNTIASAAVVSITDELGIHIGTMVVGGSSSGSLDLNGYRISTAVWASTSVSGVLLNIRYANAQ